MLKVLRFFLLFLHGEQNVVKIREPPKEEKTDKAKYSIGLKTKFEILISARSNIVILKNLKIGKKQFKVSFCVKLSNNFYKSQ